MSDESLPDRPYLMKLKPLKPTDRYKQTIYYDFEQRNPKKQEYRLDVPTMDFLSEPGIPAFMAPFEKYFYQKNPNFFKESFDRRLDRGNEEELKMLLLPKPPKKSRFCGICSQFYEEYFMHVSSEAHRMKFLSHPFLSQLCKEMVKVHTDFLKDRDQYISVPAMSPDVSPREEGKSLFDCEKRQDSKTFEQVEIRNEKFSQEVHNEIQDVSLKENINVKTAKKEAYQGKKTTKKKEKSIKPFSQSQADANDAKTGPQTGSFHVDTVGIQKNEKAEVSENVLANWNPERRPPAEQSNRVYVKLNGKKSNVPEDVGKSKMVSHSFGSVNIKPNLGKEIGFVKYNPKRVSENSREKVQLDHIGEVKDENSEMSEIRFQRKHPDRNLKRDWWKLAESTEDLISPIKKIKISDQHNPRLENEMIRIDLQACSNTKWENLKKSFTGFIDELKGTYSKIYKFWKKRDPNDQG